MNNTEHERVLIWRKPLKAIKTVGFFLSKFSKMLMLKCQGWVLSECLTLQWLVLVVTLTTSRVSYTHAGGDTCEGFFLTGHLEWEGSP